MEQSCVKYYVSGRVQGVFYRDSARRKALALGLKGWVRNMPDGRVEVTACGPMQKLQDFEAWLWQGPSAAMVLEVLSQEIAWEDHSDFVVR